MSEETKENVIEGLTPGFLLCLAPVGSGTAPLQIAIDCLPAYLQGLYRHRIATLHGLEAAADEAFASALFTRPRLLGRALFTPGDIENFVQELFTI